MKTCWRSSVFAFQTPQSSLAACAPFGKLPSLSGVTCTCCLVSQMTHLCILATLTVELYTITLTAGLLIMVVKCVGCSPSVCLFGFRVVTLAPHLHPYHTHFWSVCPVKMVISCVYMRINTEAKPIISLEKSEILTSNTIARTVFIVIEYNWNTCRKRIKMIKDYNIISKEMVKV